MLLAFQSGLCGGFAAWASVVRCLGRFCGLLSYEYDFRQVVASHLLVPHFLTKSACLCVGMSFLAYTLLGDKSTVVSEGNSGE